MVKHKVNDVQDSQTALPPMTNYPMHPHQVIAHQLDTVQIDDIAQLLALAFEEGSGSSQICNAQGEELLRRLYVLFQSGLKLQAAVNQEVLSVMKDEKVIGAAVIQEPNSSFPIWAKILWLLQVSIGISPAVAKHLWQSLRILEQHHPSEPHYYLVLLGIHPIFQSQGCARALLDALHQRSEEHPLSVGVYLETANPRNIAFYQKFGYQLKTQVNIKGVRNFIMFRPNLSVSDNFVRGIR
jgi:ribosomal protein S18 acetylase RimI-like enzyme